MQTQINFPICICSGRLTFCGINTQPLITPMRALISRHSTLGYSQLLYAPRFSTAGCKSWPFINKFLYCVAWAQPKTY